MQKIDLFSGYDSATLFDKVRRQATEEISQWPESNFAQSEVMFWINKILAKHPQLPEIDFHAQRESAVEKICALSSLEPGAREGVKVRVNVLLFEYPFRGESYLLGCYPQHPVAKSAGVCYVDPAKQLISIEYTGFGKSPRKVFSDHKAFLAELRECYDLLKKEFEAFYKQFPDFLKAAAERERKAFEEISGLLSGMRQTGQEGIPFRPSI